MSADADRTGMSTHNAPEYIIVQAGGKGTRLKQLTRNKPKAIVSVNNLPMIFHLFRKYPESKFVIIGDYLKDVLDRYLEAFATVRFITVGTDGHGGTCSGIGNALSKIPEDTRFMLIWSDLILSDEFQIPYSDGNVIGISKDFQCRWSYSNDSFVEEPSYKDGVAGLFVFDDKSILKDIPVEGEFVRWLQKERMTFQRADLNGTSEHGLLNTIDQPSSGKCRPFNSMKIKGEYIIKTGIDEQGRKLAVREKAWYNHVKGLDVAIPRIISMEPLTMEKIDGGNIFEYDYDIEKKRDILCRIMQSLKDLHEYDQSVTDWFSMKDAYYAKTVDRLRKVRDLIPKSDEPFITINGKRCRNVFFHMDEFKKRLDGIPCEKFCLIHGDCTFSNMMLRHGEEPVFIDPRGYFGYSELVGDPNYDWAKL
ncbi:MAG: phosphotransferase, partial [Candidatus Methanomethylophilaceae archaeon]|nr:phosphotransferase [Candidatus Methanomethylophilaceae archaeon]